MASDGPGMSSDPPEDHTEDGVHLKATSQADTPSPPAHTNPESAGRVVCQFFQKGKCHFGHRCRLSHSNPPLDDSGAVSPDQDDKSDEERTEKHKTKINKVNKASKGKETGKKPRMRTADDVISRILWDPSVDAEEFVVGYLDRFLGVVERPFCEFNWDTNPCDCDYTSELALPRHRIQYFSFRGHRVWDRHSRTDRVFGSTGQSLAPPFGGEGEVKGINTGDQEQLEDNRIEEQPSAVCGQEESKMEACGHTESTHLEKEKPNGTSVLSPGSTQPAPKCGGNISQEQQDPRGACVEEEAVNRRAVSVEEEAQLEEKWEGNEDASSYLESLNLNQNPPAPLEQREEKRGGRPPKKRPTHFITFRANTPAILSCFQQLQEEITSLLPASAPHWQTASSLHVTLCLLVLQGPAEVAAAGEILRRFAQLDRNPPVAVTFPVKLKHFSGKVLFLSPQPQLQLQQLNNGLQEAFRKEGWLHRDSYNPRYHLTLAKVDDVEGERIFEGVGDLKVGKSLHFGRLPINTLHLCCVNGSKVDGFYQSLCTVNLR
ncbi:leukocyte receptor cluster member 9 isoform X2 [Betta splendens]|uniref:Leukocyte receptor cluster member 9 isoform X2 n=1 Tax=Betta splendens TaxID=158456 RepID=A0A6P7KYC9_BETSP|nr:leukocyte receptor cluster member 9 isoform X2 [Betta splendens]